MGNLGSAAYVKPGSHQCLGSKCCSSHAKIASNSTQLRRYMPRSRGIDGPRFEAASFVLSLHLLFKRVRRPRERAAC